MSHSITIEPKILSLLPENLDGKRILDVGIGHSMWGFLIRTWKKGRPYIVGVDPFPLYIENASRLDLYDELYTMTGQQYLEEHPDQFDYIIICEVMEHHQTKEAAWSLLKSLESRVKPGGTLILSTPDGKSFGGPMFDGNELNDHPIGFSHKEFSAKGYRIERIIKEGFSLGHIVGPIAKAWWTLRWRHPPATHTTVAWRTF